MRLSENRMVPPDIRRAWSTVPIVRRTDVLVVGGGPAGCAAAIAAAREGAQVLLVEQYGFLGGMATAALVPAFCPFTDQEKPITRGIGLAILEDMKRGMPHVAPTNYDWVPIDPERLKVIYEERVLASGAHLLFLTHFIDAPPGPYGEVTSVILHHKAGLERVEADVVVDCTGDADVAAAAGAAFAQGDAETGELQPCTMCFVLAGVDNQRLQAYLWADGGRDLLIKELIARAKAAGDLQIVEDAANVAYQSESTIGLNFSHIFDVDATDAEQLSQAHVQGRKLIRRLTDFMRKYAPGCEKAYLVSSGVQIGVRETRRIVGDYVLTLDDYLARRSFPDEIARNSYYIDVHLSQREWERHLGQGVDWGARIHQYRAGESHGIPYRCLIPSDVRNLLVAGRCISTDRPVQGSTRATPVCLATGEAAGLAAALAAGFHGGDVRAVDADDLRQRLRAHGQYLP
jgi:hypothetical protein